MKLFYNSANLMTSGGMMSPVMNQQPVKRMSVGDAFGEVGAPPPHVMENVYGMQQMGMGGMQNGGMGMPTGMGMGMGNMQQMGGMNNMQMGNMSSMQQQLQQQQQQARNSNMFNSSGGF